MGARIERREPDVGDRVGDRDGGQAGATERLFPNAGDAVGDRDGGQVGAVVERPAFNAGDAGAYRDAGQAGAEVERIVPDAGDRVGDRGVSDFAPGALNERGLALVEQDSIHTAVVGILRVHRYSRQSGAAIERTNSDAGDAAGDSDAGHIGTRIERSGCEGGDRQAVGHAGYSHGTAGTGVFGDGDRAAIARESELSLHHGGQRQQ